MLRRFMASVSGFWMMVIVGSFIAIQWGVADLGSRFRVEIYKKTLQMITIRYKYSLSLYLLQRAFSLQGTKKGTC